MIIWENVPTAIALITIGVIIIWTARSLSNLNKERMRIWERKEAKNGRDERKV